MSNIFPEHLEDLRKSGLRDEIVAEMGCHSVPGERVKAHLGFTLPGIESVLCFPYAGTGGHHRDKVFPPNIKDSEGRSIKYLQPKGSPSRLYVLPSVAQPLLDVSTPLIVTEGEKKAAALVQIGKVAVAIGGLWSWRQNGEPISDLSMVPFLGRWVELCFDSDTWNRFDLQQPLYAFAKHLQSRGASPLNLIVLPPRMDGVNGQDRN